MKIVRFEHGDAMHSGLVKADGLYPDGHCCVFWNADRTGVTELAVAFAPLVDGHLREGEQAHYDRRLHQFVDRFDMSSGNCEDGWPVEDVTPASVFACLYAEGFGTQHDFLAALGEFAKMDSCGWAREMHYRLKNELPPLDLDQHDAAGEFA